MMLRQAALRIDAARHAQEWTFSPFLESSSTYRESRHKRGMTNGAATDGESTNGVATNGVATNCAATNGAATNGAGGAGGTGGASAAPPPSDSAAALFDDGDADGDGGASPSHVTGMPLKQTLYQQASDVCCYYMPLQWGVGAATCADVIDPGGVYSRQLVKKMCHPTPLAGAACRAAARHARGQGAARRAVTLPGVLHFRADCQQAPGRARAGRVLEMTCRVYGAGLSGTAR